MTRNGRNRTSGRRQTGNPIGLDLSTIFASLEELNEMGSSYEDDGSDDSVWDDSPEHSSSEEERSNNKCFVTLLDSHLLKDLFFCKKDGQFGKPLIHANNTESYESVYRLLEEVEILLEAWHRRTKYTFTAHLSYGKNETSTDDKLKGKKHWSSSDLEKVPGKAPDSDINKHLSIKKFIQSTKTFYEVFESHEEYHAVLGSLRIMRKFIFELVFSKIKTMMPERFLKRLPVHLWEKIWRYTQIPYSRNGSLHIGTISNEFLDAEVEKERLKDFFGSAANIFLLILEILFKSHSHIQEMSLLFPSNDIWPLAQHEEVIARKSMAVPYSRWLFDYFRSLMEKHFNRLEDFIRPQEENDEMNILKLIDRGQYSICNPKLNEELDLSSEFKEAYLIFPDISCNVIALLDKHEDKGKVSSCKIVLYDVIHHHKIGSIQIEMKNFFFCYDIKNRITLTKSCLAVFLPTEPQDRYERIFKNTILFWHFSDKSQGEFALNRKDAQEVWYETSRQPTDWYIGCGEKNYLKMTEDENGHCTFLVDQKVTYVNSGHPVLRFFDSSTLGNADHKVMNLKSDNHKLKWFKGKCFMLADYEDKAFFFCRSDPPRIVKKYSFHDFCEENHYHDKDESACTYGVLSDQLFERKQFLFLSDHAHSFLLFSYDETSEHGIPKLIAKGSTHVFNFELKYFQQSPRRASLVDGVLFALTDRNIRLLFHTWLWGNNDKAKVPVGDVVAFDCIKGKMHPIVSLVKKDPEPVYGSGYSGHLFVNEQSKTFSLNSKSQHFLYLPNSTTITIISKKPMTIKFEESPRAVVETDKERFKPAYEEMMEKKAQSEQAKINLEKAKARFVDTQIVLDGEIISFKSNHGYVKPTGELAKSLGSLFFAYSDITGKPKKPIIRYKTRARFRVISEVNGSLKAVNVSLLK